MKELFDEIQSSYSRRFYPRQKKCFREFMTGKFNALGYENTQCDKHGNIIVGDADNAEIVYSAHYDTPPISPYITPFTRMFGHVIGMFVSIFALLVFFVALNLCIGLLGDSLAVKIINGISPMLILIAMFCLPNPKNANDNTSGVLAVYELAKALSKQEGARVAFVLFNSEEWGLLGSTAFVKDYAKRNGKKPQFLLVNLDCVGAGDKFIIANSKTSDAFTQSLAAITESSLTIKRGSLLLASDNLAFPNAISIFAAKKSLVGALYLPQIHMPNDKKLDFETLSSSVEIALKAHSLITQPQQ